MESLETLTEAVEHLLDKSAAQESLLFLLAHYVVETGAVTAPALAEHLRRYDVPSDTPEILVMRNFYADVIGGASRAA
jgi:hypothetical protein